MIEEDSFAGAWGWQHDDSRLVGPPPRTWTQHIAATTERLSVREDIALTDGTAIIVQVEAACDGDYPGKKQGRVSFTELLTVSVDGCTMTATYSVHGRDARDITSVAVFARC